MQALHDIRVVGNLKVRHHRLAVALNFDIAGIVLADRNRRVHNLRDGQHNLPDSGRDFRLSRLEGRKALVNLCDFFLRLLGLVLLALSHQSADAL